MDNRIDTTQYSGWRWIRAVVQKYWWWYLAWTFIAGLAIGAMFHG